MSRKLSDHSPWRCKCACFLCVDLRVRLSSPSRDHLTANIPSELLVLKMDYEIPKNWKFISFNKCTFQHELLLHTSYQFHSDIYTKWGRFKEYCHFNGIMNFTIQSSRENYFASAKFVQWSFDWVRVIWYLSDNSLSNHFPRFSYTSIRTTDRNEYM